jgi:Uma2 family endonuclease
VRTPTSIRYPDSLVHCSYIPPNSTFAPAPVVIFEVLSPSSAARDLGAKTAEYLSLPSLRRYVVLHQCAAAANVFFRSDDGDWRHEFLAAEDALALPEIGVEVALAEIYDGIEF